MKKRTQSNFFPALGLCWLLFWVSGCGAKGYIVASVQSVIGLDVSENPKTQVPHVRFGFVRSQYFYVPTGKAAGGSGRAADTPELVSVMEVDLRFLNYARIHERFAVGKGAVQAPAAQQLFAGLPPLSPRPEVLRLQEELGTLLRQPGMAAKARKCLRENFPPDTPYLGDPVKFVRRQQDPEPLIKLKECLEKP